MTAPTETKALVERLRDFPLPMLTDDECKTLRQAADALEALTREPDDGTVERLSGLLREWNKQLGGCEHGSYVIGGCGKCLGCRTRAAGIVVIGIYTKGDQQQ